MDIMDVLFIANFPNKKQTKKNSNPTKLFHSISYLYEIKLKKRALDFDYSSAIPQQILTRPRTTLQ